MLPILLLKWCAASSLVTFFICFWDKRAAIKQKWRISEKQFFIMALCGGGAGLLLGMKIFRHKIRKLSFWLVGWSTTLLWATGIIYLAII